MSGRDCSFASQTPPGHPSTSSTPSHERSITPVCNHSQDKLAHSQVTPLTTGTGTVSHSDLPGRPCISGRPDLTLDEAVNLNHVELLIHAISDKELFNLGDRIGDYSSNISPILERCLNSPYLLHQLLAFSARHLAFLHPERAPSYLHQAVTLQTRAVSLFNAAWTEVDQSNCVAILLFSVALGHHLLADTLAKRDPGGLDGFMCYYVQCMEMHRGIYTVARTAWPLLMESELGPILSFSSQFTSRRPRGNHCQVILELVDGSSGLEEMDREACRLAIQYLQVGFDAILAEEEEDEPNRYQMLFSWTMLAPPEFTDLLAAKRPEVLVLLGYYALLLHYGRSMWQVGDAGTYILEMVVEYLGPEWHHWLQYPREMIAKSLE